MEDSGSRVGQRVRSLRDQRGWTARKLAEECARAGMPSLTRSTLAKIESGVRKSVTAEELVVLAQAFGVGVPDLLPGGAPSPGLPGSADSVQAPRPQRDSAGLPARSGENAGPFFFLSYARTPKYDPSDPSDPDLWVNKLFENLCQHIMQLTSVPPGAVGFMDREMRPGETWSASLSQALATCRVFVPLYSNRYFVSEQCGKEWYAFARRVLDTEAKSARRTDAIIPAVWVPVDTDKMPEAAQNVQSRYRGLSDAYVSHGFYGIMKLSRYRDVYEEAVYLLARRIVHAAEEEPVRPGKPVDYLALESAFGQPWSHDHGARLRIRVVAPSSGNLPAGRSGYHYGPTALDWNPYRPDLVRPLAEHACDVVRTLDYRPEVGGLDEHGAGLTGDGPPMAPEVVLVDPWAAAQPELAQALQRFNSAAKPWIQVVVPWNQADTQTADSAPRLRDELDRSLHAKLTEGRAVSVVAARGAPGLEEFDMALAAAVQTAVRHFLQHAKVHPPAGSAWGRSGLLQATTDPERTHD